MANKKLKSILASEQFNKDYPNQPVAHFFGGEILDEQPESKKYLKEVLENKYKSKLFKTQLVYKYDPLNKTNFHEYIDNKEGIFVLAKVGNEHIVGGFYNGKLLPKIGTDKDAILISVNNK